MPDLTCSLLEDLAVLDVRGPDTVSFLQGQLSHDVTLLASRGNLLTALHNPQGRVLAILRLVHMAQDHVLVVLPAELSEQIARLLAKFVLRAKVSITGVNATWRVYGITGPDAAAAASTRLCIAMDEAGWRQMIVAPRSEPLPEADLIPRDTWRLADIEAGIPEVFASTSGKFVAQMLNLDLVDAISLNKGCYTGQEVVARAHYRGQVKRRMQRFLLDFAVTLHPGVSVQLADGRMALIVTSACGEDDSLQFLAVTQAADIDSDTATAVSDSTGAQPLDSVALPLPYALPL